MLEREPQKEVNYERSSFWKQIVEVLLSEMKFAPDVDKTPDVIADGEHNSENNNDVKEAKVSDRVS